MTEVSTPTCRGHSLADFLVVNDQTDIDDAATRRAEHIRLLSLAENVRSLRLDANRPEAVERQHGRGKLTARERIDLLTDEDSFHEWGILVEPARETAFTEDIDAPGDGVVTGSALIDGRPVTVIAFDYTILGGSNGKAGGAKVTKAIEDSLHHGRPLIMLQEGGGHRIQDGLDSRHFAHASSLFQQMALLSGWVPIVAVMLGPGFAGPTNFAAMADLVVMLRGSSTMGLAGPALVKAATGEDVTNEELGGAAIQADKYGMADLAVDDEAAAFQAVSDFLSYLPTTSENLPSRRVVADQANRRGEELYEIVPPNTRKVYDMGKVIDVIADDSSVFELKPTFAPNVITAFATLDGRPVGFYANQPLRKAGVLDSPACEKAAHFLALCDSFGLPIISLIDMPGFAIGSAAERTALGRRSGKLVHELGHLTVPIVSVVLRKGYGLGYFAMAGGRSFSAVGAFAWPTAEICAMSVEGAVDVAYRRDYEAAEDPDARRSELISVFKGQLGAVRAADGFGVDDIIDPADTRSIIIRTLSDASPRSWSRHPPKHRTIPPI